MSEILLGAHTVKSHGLKVARTHKHDWIMVLLLVVIDALLNFIEPFHRFVGEGMMTDFKYPFHQDTIPFWVVGIVVILLPLIVFLVYYLFRKDVYDLHHATMGLLFSVLITGVITDSIKDAVGRPRPNFFFRCFPDGKAVFNNVTGNVVCHGHVKDIKEGYKSFPSGHTSWSFAGLTFLAWYMSGKIRAFDRRGHVAKLCILFLPIMLATLVGISRVDDYWHHWTDVFAGALIGSTVASFCYLQAFPFPNREDGWAPHVYFEVLADRSSAQSAPRSFSIQMRRRDAETGMLMGPENDSIGSNCQDTSPTIEGMEAGKRY
ncbi:hypothetical protein SLA2020_253370 [Shorea laevis]